jgi:hypothetical protein
MNAVAELAPDVSPVVLAGLLFAARKELDRLGLRHPTLDEILEATGVGRSRAYEVAAMIPGVLAGLVRPPGRPPAPPPTHQESNELSDRVRDYLMDHPGCVTGRGRRRSYSTGFRWFVLDLIDAHSGLALTEVAASVGVPLPTLRDWLRAGRPEPEPPGDATLAADEAATVRIETILHEWEQWEGDFVPFCDHLREHLRIPYGRTLVASILEQIGARFPRRRPGRSPDEKAMRGAFETFFPGAQWEGDGSPIGVRVFGRAFAFNLELMVDARTGAVVGLSVRDHEDSAAVVEAFEHGVETTGSAPIVLELDPRPSNHTDEVDRAIGDTTRMPSTPGTPTSNPHVEGAHSLFQNAVPGLVIEGATAQEVARHVLELAAVTWARTLNHKPRADRTGRSRVQLYRDETPTEDQVRRARDRLRERCRRQERALDTLRRRQDPVVRAILDRAFERLGLEDPRGNVRAAIARYPIDHVLAGIAIYESKVRASTLPPDVDVRYLLGIIRNVSDTDEGQLITEALIRLRLEARDIMLEHLARARQHLETSTTDPDDLLRAMLGRAMDADRQLDRTFWLEALAEAIVARPQAEHADLLRAASRRIHTSFAVPYCDRLAAVRTLTRKVIPLE